MQPTQRYQVNWFAIIVLISIVLVIVFLVVSAIYFYNLINLKVPTTSESTFLLATAIIMAIVFFIIGMVALYEIFTHSITIYEPASPSTPVPALTPITVQPEVSVQPMLNSYPSYQDHVSISLHDDQDSYEMQTIMTR